MEHSICFQTVVKNLSAVHTLKPLWVSIEPTVRNHMKASRQGPNYFFAARVVVRSSEQYLASRHTQHTAR